jgi:hypothetical protein
MYCSGRLYRFGDAKSGRRPPPQSRRLLAAQRLPLQMSYSSRTHVVRYGTGRSAISDDKSDESARVANLAVDSR